MFLSGHIRSRFIARAFACVLCAALLVSASWAGGKGKNKKKASSPTVDITKLVWPSPPQTARFSYVGQYSGEADLLGRNRKSNWLERVAGVTLDDADRPRMVKPYGVAVDSKGLIYVADSGAKVVFVFNLEKKELSLLGDKPPAQFTVPIGIAVDDKDRVFVSDSVMHRITCFDTNGDVAAIFGDEDLDRPAGMAVDNVLRRLYVADYKKSRLAIFNLDTLKLVRYWNGTAPGDVDPFGTLGTPSNIAVDLDGLVYVVDTILNRIEIFDADGNLVRAFGEQGDRMGKFLRPKGIAVDSDGHIYVADSQFNNFQVFTPLGQPLLAIGSFGAQPGQWGLMTGIAIDQQNRVIVTDQLPARIQVLRYVTDAEAAAEEKKAGNATGQKAAAAGEAEGKQTSPK